MSRTTYAFAFLAVIAVMAFAGCGSSDDGTSGGAYGGTGDAGSSESEGFTVYVFHGDKVLESNCYGACAKTWPPVSSGPDPQVEGEGANRNLLAQSPRKDGTQQVFYATHPLYTYSGDKKPGEANGQDIDSFGAEWYALTGNGQEAGD